MNIFDFPMTAIVLAFAGEPLVWAGVALVVICSYFFTRWDNKRRLARKAAKKARKRAAKIALIREALRPSLNNTPA